MKSHAKTHVLVVGLIALFAAGAAFAAVHVAVTVRTAHNATLNTTILVDQNGRTLYHITTDKGGNITCSGACATIRPLARRSEGNEADSGAWDRQEQARDGQAAGRTDPGHLRGSDPLPLLG